MKSIKIISLCIVIAFSALLMGCEEHTNANAGKEKLVQDDEHISIKVLTERSMWSDSIKSVATGKIRSVLAYYQAEHPNVDINVETLPKYGEDRETLLRHRRVALLAGDVPDIYLMPTLSYSQTNRPEKLSKAYESLFRDVAQAQTNSWFADISAYFDSDDDLHSEELKKEVMDAGVIGDARYILPLGYTFELFVTEESLWNDLSERSNAVKGSENILQTLVEMNTLEWIPQDELWWYHFPLNELPELCDYNEEKVLVSEADFVSLFKRLNNLYQSQRERDIAIKPPNYIGWEGYMNGNRFAKSPFDDATFLLRGSPEILLALLPTSKCVGEKLKIIPLRTERGDIVANITYWGAISSRCKNKDIAYDILRLFLSPEVQHGTELMDSKGKTYSCKFDIGYYPGWPVRYKGFASVRWEDMRSEIQIRDGREDRKEELLAVQIDDEDFSVLEEEIAYARFPSVLDQEIYALLEPLREQAVSDEEIEKIAQTFVRNLKYHLAEG